MTDFRKHLTPPPLIRPTVRFWCCGIALSCSFSAVAFADDDQPIVPETVESGRSVEFRRDVYPIFAGSCLACHNKTKAEIDLVLESAQSAITGGASGAGIIPGNPDESPLYLAAARLEEPVMPPLLNNVQAKPLTPEQLGLLRKWILDGAKADDGTTDAHLAWQDLNEELNAVYSIDAGPYGRFVAAGRANKVTVYDLKGSDSARLLTDPELTAPGVTHRDYVHAIAFHPSGDLIATAGYRVVKIWKRQAAVAVPKDDAAPLSDTVLSGDGTLQIRISGDGIARMWHVAENRVIADLNRDLLRKRRITRLEVDRAMREARVRVVKAQVAADQKRLNEQNAGHKAAVEKHIRAVAAVTKAVKKHTDVKAALTEPEQQLSEDPENEELKKKVKELRKAEQDASMALTAGKNAVDSAARGIELAIQSVTRARERLHARKQLQTQTNTELQQATVNRDEATAADTAAMHVVAAVFIPGMPLAATIEQSGTVRIWDTGDGSPVDVISSEQPVDGVVTATSCNGRLVTIASDGGTKTAVDLFPEWQLVRNLGSQTDGTDSVFTDRVLALAFSPDGSRLAAGGGEASRSGQLTIWKTTDWTLERQIPDAHSDTVYGLDFSADGQLLASGAADKFVKVFSVETGAHMRSYEGHTHHVMDVSWKADRTSLASAGADNVIKVWNAETGEQRRTISTYKKQVTSVQYIGLEDNILSSSGDRRVILHRAGDGAAYREFGGSSDFVYCSAITHDGQIVVAGGEDGVVRVWNGADAVAVTKFEP